MLCRALFAAVVVSYVLCVLLLSGVQKDDLDEGTLRKLQRHNVNIADIEDRKLREQCFVENETSTSAPEQENLKEEENKTTAKPTSSEFDGDVRASQAQFKKLFDFFKKQESKKEDNVKETTTPPLIQSGKIINFNTLPSSVRYRVIKDIADSVTELSQNTSTKKDNEKATTANDDQHKEKPLQIFDKTQQEFKSPSITNKTSIKENSNNVGYINKIISQILNQKQLKAKTANDDQDKEKPLQISDKTQQEFKNPSITNEKPVEENSNNDGYIKKIISQILNQNQLKAKTANDDQDKEKPLQISDKTQQEFKTPSITNEKPVQENSNNDGYIKKIISQILNQNQLKAKTVNDDQDKEKPLQISDKTQQEFKTPSITNEKPVQENSNNVGYISKIVSQILNQKQLNQVETSAVPFELNVKKYIQGKDPTVAENSLSRRTYPSNYYLNTFNVTGKLNNIEPDERAKNKEESEIIASILNQLRNRDRLPTAYIKENLNKYGQYFTDRWNPKQLETNSNGEQKEALDFENTGALATDVLSRSRDVPDKNQQINNKWSLDIDSGSAKAFGTYLKEQRSPPINQIIERGKTINENYPSVNEEYKMKWPYYIENLSKKQEPISEMEQRTAIDALNGRYLTMSKKNDRNNDEEYKRTRTYFIANQNNKHASNIEDEAKISSFDQTDDHERVTNTLVNIEKYPFVERQHKSKWSYDDRNAQELESKLNKQQNSASIDRSYDRRDTINTNNDRSAQPIDYDDQRIKPNLGIGKKNILLSQPNELKKYFMGSQSSKREPMNIKEQRQEPQYFTNSKEPNQNTFQYELLTNNDDDNKFLVNTGTMTERSQKYIANKKSKNENKKEDNNKIETITPDVIKKIADTVKTIVLKDLKKEQSTKKPTTTLTTTTKTTTTILVTTTATPRTTTQTTTPTTTKTTTQTTAKTTTQTTTTPTTQTTTKTTPIPITTVKELSSTAAKEDHVKIQEASKALEQFMKVFEQFKTMKNEIESPYNVLQPKSVNVVNEKPVNNMNTLSYPPTMNYYGSRNSKSRSKAIILDPYTDKVTPNPITIQNKAPSNNIFAAPPGQALTIQSNYDIVPPLNIPLSNPLMQTVIITTRSPFIVEQIVPHHSNTLISQRKPDRYQAQKLELYRSNPSKHRNYREPYHFKFDTKSKSRNIRKEHTYSKPYMPRTYRDEEKFHEKLERAFEERTRLMSAERKCFGSEETCNEKVAKRNQRPLAHAPSTYDDSHFRNFLKTQQKVNDMLERILATKTKYENRPPSAEII